VAQADQGQKCISSASLCQFETRIGQKDAALAGGVLGVRQAGPARAISQRIFIRTSAPCLNVVILPRKTSRAIKPR